MCRGDSTTCPANSFLMSTSGNCHACPSGSFTLANNQNNTCFCGADYYSSLANPPGTTGLGATLRPCQSCSGAHASTFGKTGQSTCVCLADYYSDPSVVQNGGKGGTTGSSLTPCMSCPVGKTTQGLTGCDSANYCVPSPATPMPTIAPSTYAPSALPTPISNKTSIATPPPDAVAIPSPLLASPLTQTLTPVIVKAKIYYYIPPFVVFFLTLFGILVLLDILGVLKSILRNIEAEALSSRVYLPRDPVILGMKDKRVLSVSRSSRKGESA